MSNAIGNKEKARKALEVIRANFKFGIIVKIFSYILLIDLAFVFLYPFIFMIITSLKSPSDLTDLSVVWVPSKLYFKNYEYAFTALRYLTTLKNSVVLTLITTFGHELMCAFIAYGFCRFKFPFKKLMFFIVIFTIIVPTQTIAVPIYIVNSLFKFVGSPLYLSLIVPTFFGFGLKGGLFIFIFYSFFQSLPVALEEAATIDGCSAFKTYFKIIIPSATSSFLICFVLSTVWHWNDYFEPNLYITRANSFLLPQMLPGIISMMKAISKATTLEMAQLKDMYNQAVIMASTVMAVLPLLVMYIFVQAKFVEGIGRSGLTGE